MMHSDMSQYSKVFDIRLLPYDLTYEVSVLNAQAVYTNAQLQVLRQVLPSDVLSLARTSKEF